jgi:hypothetical protein
MIGGERVDGWRAACSGAVTGDTDVCECENCKNGNTQCNSTTGSEL